MRLFFLRLAHRYWIFSLLILGGGPLSGFAQSNGKYLNGAIQTPLPASAGTYRAFSGKSHGVLLWAGGGKIYRGEGSEKAKMEPTAALVVGTRDAAGKITWKVDPAAQLSAPMIAGATVQLDDGLLCVAAAEPTPHSPAFLLRWDPDRQRVQRSDLPDFPVPLQGGSGNQIGPYAYVSAVSCAGEPILFRYDVEGAAGRWERRTPCPGPPAPFASTAVQADGVGEKLYLFAGNTGPNPQNDTWSYDPATDAWQARAPIAVAGQPYFPVARPVIDAGVHHILLFGARRDPNHRQRTILAYHTITDTWVAVDTAAQELPEHTRAHWWAGKIVLAGGTLSPGVGSLTVREFTPDPLPEGLSGVDYLVIVLYLVILVWMGTHFMRRGRTTADYFKAGQRIPWWAAGISIFGTSLSAITYMAVPAKAYGTDWLFIWLNVAQILTAPLVIWLVLPFFRRLNVTTAYEYLERRFHVVVRVIGGLAFLLFQFGRIGIVLFLPAIALSVVTGVSIYTCIVVMAGLSIFYTVLGGIEAVIWTDVKQVAVLTTGAVVSLLLMGGGVEGGFDHLVDIAAGDGKLRLFNFDFDFTSPSLWVVIGGGIGTNLINQSSDQTFVQRYLTTRSEKAAARSLLTPAALVIPISLLFFGLGTSLYGFYKVNPGELNPVLNNADAIFPWYIITQLPAGLSGLLIAGIFAASMSSLDSSLNSASAVITSDFYRRFRKAGPDRHYLTIARIATVAMGLLGMGFALLLAGAEIKSLWDEFSKVLGLFAGGLAGLFLLGMSVRHANTAGALIGFAVSAAVQYWVSSTGAVHFLLYTFTGLASCYIVGWAASWAFPRKKDLHGLTIRTIRKIKPED
ncbi:MAG: sodium/solute symporter [Bacteroidota bacterium]